ncbi:MAG: RNase adapter RapZ [Holophagales bacterium]|nr:RNase adapter RapZ [Holophagales bacterium]
MSRGSFGNPPEEGRRERPKLVLVTGLSGSGKSIAVNALEDLGYYCLDNLPLSLLRVFLGDLDRHALGRRRIAVVTDVRSPGFAESIPELLGDLETSPTDSLLVYLEASEETLVRRYSETRRSHPMGEGDRPVVDGIRRERRLFEPIRERADRIFDTSDWSVHDMRKAIFRELGEDGDAAGPLVVSLVSFGFKHGPPAGADLMIDVRFLANPHFIPGLREQTGKDTGVIEFLDREADFAELLGRLEDLLFFLLPRYRAENRRYLTLAVGCTGGRHRSVATVEQLAARLADSGWSVRTSHRDIGRR